MARGEWTAATLPSLPESDGMDAQAYEELRLARLSASSRLLEAERLEREASAARREANKAREHYAAELEAMATHSLFDELP